MSLPSYPEYKMSGLDWLPEVPVHWIDKKVARDIPFVVGWTPPSGKDEYYDGQLPWVTIADMTQMTVEDTKSKISQLAVKDKGAKIVPAESMLFSFKLSVGKVAFLKIDSYTNEAIASFLFNRQVELTYWKYAAPEFIPRYGRENIYGATLLNQELISSVRFFAPALTEQIQIALFLDYETARIDTLIAEQQRLIELLKEKRQAVVSHAVTKGLDPTVPMKVSGVEWLGEVPAHWETTALNKLTDKITNGYVGPTRDILVESGVPYIQATHIKKGIVNFDDNYFVTPEWSNRMAKSILKEDDVLIVQTGAGTGDIGIVSSKERGYNCHALIILQSKKCILSGLYLSSILRSQFGQSVLFSIRTGGMHPHLNCGEVKFVKIPVPPLEEQEEISTFLQTFSASADQLIKEAKAATQLLQERRSALISAAVTGKIDVRDWQPTEKRKLLDLNEQATSREATP